MVPVIVRKEDEATLGLVDLQIDKLLPRGHAVSLSFLVTSITYSSWLVSKALS